MDKNQDLGSGIRDKHLGSATLAGRYVPPLERKLRKIFFSSFLISLVTSMYFKNDGLLPLSVILLKIQIFLLLKASKPCTKKNEDPRVDFIMINGKTGH